VDEQRLGELFRHAVGDAPPASFGCTEVVAASRRATARRRHALAGGTMLGAAVLTGGLIVSGLVGAHPSEETPAAAPAAPQIEALDSGPLDTLGAPAASTPVDTGLLGCGPLDGALVAELTAVLSDRGAAVSGPASEIPGEGFPQPCPEGARTAAVPVAGGTLHVVLVRQADQPEPVQTASPDGRRGHAVVLDGGRELTVISIPGTPGQPAPLADDLPALATELAGRLTR